MIFGDTLFQILVFMMSVYYTIVAEKELHDKVSPLLYWYYKNFKKLLDALPIDKKIKEEISNTLTQAL